MNVDDGSSHAGTEAALLQVGGVIGRGAAAPLLWWRPTGGQYDASRVVTGQSMLAFDGVRVRFVLPEDASAGYLKLSIPALAGGHALTAMTLEGVRLAGLSRHVMAASAPWHAPGGDIDRVAFDASAGRPWCELDVRTLGDGDGRRLGPVLEVDVRRLDPAPGMRVAIAALQQALADAERGRQQIDFGRQVEQTSRLDALEARAVALEALARGLVQGREADEASAAIRHLESADATRSLQLAVSAGVEEAAKAVQRDVSAAMAAGFQAQADSALQRETAVAAALSARLDALQSDLAIVRKGVENVFWRRWLRALRGRPAA